MVPGSFYLGVLLKAGFIFKGFYTLKMKLYAKILHKKNVLIVSFVFCLFAVQDLSFLICVTDRGVYKPILNKGRNRNV